MYSNNSFWVVKITLHQDLYIILESINTYVELCKAMLFAGSMLLKANIVTSFPVLQNVHTIIFVTGLYLVFYAKVLW